MHHALIIEDQPIIAMMIEDELKDLGFGSFEVASTEADAIAAAERRCPDLITADGTLDDGSGVAAILHICRDKFIPVVFITGDPESVTAFGSANAEFRRPRLKAARPLPATTGPTSWLSRSVTQSAFGDITGQTRFSAATNLISKHCKSLGSQMQEDPC